MTKKDMLFVKDTCKYCQEVITKLNQSNVFVMIDVDKMFDRLPIFVKQVPLIFTTDHKIIVGDNVMEYIIHTLRSFRKKVQQITDDKKQTQTHDPSSFSFGSQNFETIQPNEYPGMEFGGNKFDLIQASEETQQHTQGHNGRAPKISPDTYEAFLAQRRAETPISGNMR